MLTFNNGMSKVFVLKKFRYVLQYNVLRIARLTCKFVRGSEVFIKILKENLNFLMVKNLTNKSGRTERKNVK